MIDNIHNFKKKLEIKLEQCMNNFKVNINKIYVGRVSSRILDAIMVEYYGALVPISQITNSIVTNSKTLTITVFDCKMLKIIEKAISSSGMGLVPISNQDVIRITLPSLTEDRRRTLIKIVRFEAEKSKISMRNIRRTFNDQIKTLLKNKNISIDDEFRFQNEIQNLTNLWIQNIDSVLKDKELELMTF